jgi:hypothetical protein
MGNLCSAREHSVQFFVQFFYTVKLHSLTQSVWGPLDWFEIVNGTDMDRRLSDVTFSTEL